MARTGTALLIVLCIGVLSTACSARGEGGSSLDSLELPQSNYYAIDTPKGRMIVRLFDETPQHRDNFKRLVAQSFYDSTAFHRVISGFMIQGGDPNSRDDDPSDDGQGGPGYTIPAEILPDRYHVRGALATARTGDQVNPERASSGSQFYIVHGTLFDDATLDEVQAQIRLATQDPEFAFPEEIRHAYRTEGGAPNLDRQYTVFGELVDGFDVLDAVANTATARSTGNPAPPHLADRPIETVRMTVSSLDDTTDAR